MVLSTDDGCIRINTLSFKLCLTLFYVGTPLDRMKKVENYNFLCNETLVLLQRYHGGVGRFRPPRGVELKMTDERCCALDDDNPDELRARMPCQCAISKLKLSLTIAEFRSGVTVTSSNSSSSVRE